MRDVNDILSDINEMVYHVAQTKLETNNPELARQCSLAIELGDEAYELIGAFRDVMDKWEVRDETHTR